MKEQICKHEGRQGTWREGSELGYWYKFVTYKWCPYLSTHILSCVLVHMHTRVCVQACSSCLACWEDTAAHAHRAVRTPGSAPPLKERGLFTERRTDESRAGKACLAMPKCNEVLKWMGGHLTKTQEPAWKDHQRQKWNNLSTKQIRYSNQLLTTRIHESVLRIYKSF